MEEFGRGHTTEAKMLMVYLRNYLYREGAPVENSQVNNVLKSAWSQSKEILKCPVGKCIFHLGGNDAPMSMAWTDVYKGVF